MLKIRLQRLGRKKRPVYRLVVAEHSAPIKGRYVEALGHYNPLSFQDAFTFDEEKIKLWINKGAQPTDTVARLLKGLGVQGIDGFVVPMADRKKKNPTEEELAAAQPPAPEAVAEKPEEAPESKPNEEVPIEAA